MRWLLKQFSLQKSVQQAAHGATASPNQDEYAESVWILYIVQRTPRSKFEQHFLSLLPFSFGQMLSNGSHLTTCFTSSVKIKYGGKKHSFLIMQSISCWSSVSVWVADTSLHIWAIKMTIAHIVAFRNVLKCTYALHSSWSVIFLAYMRHEIHFTKKTAFVYIVWHISRNERGMSGGNLSFCTHSTHTDSFSPWLIVVVGSHQFNRTQLKKIQREKETKGLMKGYQPNRNDILIHHILHGISPFTKHWLPS